MVIQEDRRQRRRRGAGLIGFTAGIAIGAAIDNDYYYGPYGWRGGVYMYNDAWDDWYDEREDAREDWQDHREDLVEERGDRARERSRSSAPSASRRVRSSGPNRRRSGPNASRRAADDRAQRTDRRASAPTAATQRRTTGRARGYSRAVRTATPNAAAPSSDAFSGYSSGKSERAASSRGQQQPEQLARRRRRRPAALDADAAWHDDQSRLVRVRWRWRGVACARSCLFARCRQPSSALASHVRRRRRTRCSR